MANYDCLVTCGTVAISHQGHFRALHLPLGSTATTTTATRKNQFGLIFLFVLLCHYSHHLYICPTFLKGVIRPGIRPRDHLYTRIASGRLWSVILVKCHVLSPTIPRCRSQTSKSPRPVPMATDTSSRPRSPSLAEYRPSPCLPGLSPLHQWVRKPDATSPRTSPRSFTSTHWTSPTPEFPLTLSFPAKRTHP